MRSIELDDNDANECDALALYVRSHWAENALDPFRSDRSVCQCAKRASAYITAHTNKRTLCRSH